MNIETTAKSPIDKGLLLLQILVACIFVGRAYQAIFWDISLRAFFWDERYAGNLVWLFTGWTWTEYATNLAVDKALTRLAMGIGFLWIICAVLSFFVQRKQRWIRRFLRVGTVFLVILHLLDWKDKFFMWGQLLEHAAQAAAPLLLIWVSTASKPFSPRFFLVVKIIIALTFFCHGLFAFGFYPVPAAWIEWCLSVFRLPDARAALFFLQIMGILDFLAAGLLFLRPSLPYALWYCVIWGLLTALARVVANFYIELPLASLHQWWFETVFRLVHGGLPLLLWYWIRQQEQRQMVQTP